MLRMNRQSLNTPKAKVREHCANYEPNFICSGCMIGEKLQQVIDPKKVGKSCLVAEGKECDYYNRCIKPIVGF